MFLELIMYIGYFHIFLTSFVKIYTLNNYLFVQIWADVPDNHSFIGESFDKMKVFFKVGFVIVRENVGFLANPARFVIFSVSRILLFTAPNSFLSLKTESSFDIEVDLFLFALS